MPSCEIGCSGYSLLVTANCEAALRELRHPSETTKLWIDSICIDQARDAVKERNTQVALMGEIYKCAKRVVVWLGQSDIRIRVALDLVMQIASSPDGHTAQDRWQSQRRWREKAQEISNSESMRLRLRGDLTSLFSDDAPEVKRESEDPLNALFQRSWFHRMWTVQEATLSWLDRIELRCGNIQMPWKYLVITVDALQVVGYKWGRWKEAMSLQYQLTIYLTGQRYLGVKESLDDNSSDPHNDPLLFSILINARRKKSTDDRDKVFALYGLLKELEIPFPAPDYSRPVEDVYREAVISCMNYDKNLYILYHAPSDRRRDGLPSWVPDLAEDGWDEGDSRYGLLRSRFAASGHSAKWSFSEDGTGLVLVGKIVDTVIFRADPMPNLDGISEELQNGLRLGLNYGGHNPETVTEYQSYNHRAYSVLKTWVEISQWSDYPTGESTKEALQRTLVNDNPKCNADAAKDNSFDHWYNTITLGELDTAAHAL